MATYNLRGCVVDVGDALDTIVCGFYMPAPTDAYDSAHTFLTYYTQFKYGAVIDPFPTAAPSGDDHADIGGQFIQIIGT